MVTKYLPVSYIPDSVTGTRLRIYLPGAHEQGVRSTAMLPRTEFIGVLRSPGA